MPRMWRLKSAFRIDLSRVDAQSIEGILRASPSPRYAPATLIKFSSQSSWSITPAPGHNSDSGSNSGERLVRPMTAELRGKLSFRLPRRLCALAAVHLRRVHYTRRGYLGNATTIRISNLYDRFIIPVSMQPENLIST